MGVGRCGTAVHHGTTPTPTLPHKAHKGGGSREWLGRNAYERRPHIIHTSATNLTPDPVQRRACLPGEAMGVATVL